jgi:hypothetical protein
VPGKGGALQGHCRTILTSTESNLLRVIDGARDSDQLVTGTGAPAHFRRIFDARVDGVTIALSHMARRTRSEETHRAKVKTSGANFEP